MEDKIEDKMREILISIGEDPEREGLVKTPERYSKALQFLTSGYNETPEEIVKDALFESSVSEMIVLRNIELFSLCEHHVLPFIGKCHIGYIPNGKMIGISKPARIVDLYARRLQIQENLTVQIAETISKLTNAHGVGVVIEAKHLCMMMRGVEKQNSEMTTSCMLGVFKEKSKTRQEFLELIK